MVAAASKSVLLLTHRTDVADAFRPPGGITWSLQVEDPRAADLEALAPRFLLAVIDFGSVPRGIRVGRVLRRENPEIEYVAVVD